MRAGFYWMAGKIDRITITDDAAKATAELSLRMGDTWNPLQPLKSGLAPWAYRQGCQQPSPILRSATCRFDKFSGGHIEVE